MAALRRQLHATPASQPEDGGEAAAFAELAANTRTFLPKLATVITQPEEIEWLRISERAKETQFNKLRSARRMTAEDARLVLKYRPVWAISTLSVPSRVPLVPALFDFVIFDEASQCDVASALPLLARARKAVVVGDPMQLRFVPTLGNAAEHALMDAASLPQEGRASIAQSINSLFDFSERRPIAKRMFLRDQFRSAPQIVDYLNSDFYNGRLICRREDEVFRPPSGYKPGLAWEDVTGIATRHEGGTINRAEAERIAAILRRLAGDPQFAGTVGVISPFNAQVAEIEIKCRDALTVQDRDRLSLRVATVDKFQGGEADVIIFSLVLAPGAPASARTFLLKERRRLNVAISRARALCIVVGDLAHAQSCGIRHIDYLAKRAITPWSPVRPPFDSGWERRLHTSMIGRGLDPIPQYPVGTRFLDFALEPNGTKLDVEVDGQRWHLDAAGNRKVSDRQRDMELRARGWKVLRFWVHELANDMEGCLDRIERELRRV
jgi:very-short-patch-repair endonuclease